MPEAAEGDWDSGNTVTGEIQADQRKVPQLIRQGTELVPSNIEIPQGTEATQLHGEGLQLIAAHILGQRRLCKPGSAELALLLLSSYLPFPSLFWRVLPTFP